MLFFILLLVVKTISRVESIGSITINSTIVSENRIIISGALKEDNTSIWSYRDYSYSFEGSDAFISIKTFPEFGKLVFSNLDFIIDIEGNFLELRNIYIKDDETTTLIWYADNNFE